MDIIIYRDRNGRKRPGVSRTCPVCQVSFVARKYYNDYDSKPDVCCSLICATDLRYGKVRRFLFLCSYCGKETVRRIKNKKNSRSGMMFCCREHKDLAQRLGSGVEGFRPAHYGAPSGRNYRKKALRRYGPKCRGCQYSELEEMLDVHHLDSNRENNSIDNLIVLCVWCHALITRGLAEVLPDRSIVKRATVAQLVVAPA